MEIKDDAAFKRQLLQEVMEKCKELPIKTKGLLKECEEWCILHPENKPHIMINDAHDTMVIVY